MPYESPSTFPPKFSPWRWQSASIPIYLSDTPNFTVSHSSTTASPHQRLATSPPPCTEAYHTLRPTLLCTSASCGSITQFSLAIPKAHVQSRPQPLLPTLITHPVVVPCINLIDSFRLVQHVVFLRVVFDRRLYGLMVRLCAGRRRAYDDFIAELALCGGQISVSACSERQGPRRSPGWSWAKCRRQRWWRGWLMTFWSGIFYRFLGEILGLAESAKYCWCWAATKADGRVF